MKKILMIIAVLSVSVLHAGAEYEFLGKLIVSKDFPASRLKLENASSFNELHICVPANSYLKVLSLRAGDTNKDLAYYLPKNYTGSTFSFPFFSHTGNKLSGGRCYLYVPGGNGRIFDQLLVKNGLNYSAVILSAASEKDTQVTIWGSN